VTLCPSAASCCGLSIAHVSLIKSLRMVSIGMNPQHALDLAVQPSPVLMQAVVKVPLPTLIVSYMSSASMLIVHIQYNLSPSHIIAFSLEKCDTKASVLVNPYKSFILTPKSRKSLYIEVEVHVCTSLGTN